MDAPNLPRSYEPNPALRVLYRWFFDNIQVDEEWVRQVRRLSNRGTVVYVLRNLNPVDFLALDHLTKRFDLPRIHYVNDLRLGMFNPLNRGLFELLSAGLSRRSVSQQLCAALEPGGSAALFLKRPPGMMELAAGQSGGRGLREGDEHVRALLELQRKRRDGQPILLVPQVFVWTNRPDTHGAQWIDALLGPREWPTALRTVAQFLSNYGNVQLRAGEPFNLAQYLEHNEQASDEVHVRRVIYALLRRLERERRSVTGPAQTAPDRQRLQVLRSPRLQQTIRHMAGERVSDRNALYRRASNMLKEMQATPNGPTLKTLDVLLDRVFHRIYAGVEVDMEGLKRLRELAKESSLVLLPSHKSHVDYLVLSYIMYENNMQLPMIAAGDNLSFFPLGPVLRRAGGFFIRRTFRGDKLYVVTVEAYVRRLLREGHMLELFLEGGRSRTGKLLPPKFGLLGMIVDAALGVKDRKVAFVPVSIGYERIVETGSYEHELAGGEKEKEDAAGLFKTTGVLRHRYGRITVQFGSALSLDNMRSELGLPIGTELNEAGTRALVTRLANRTMDEINQVTAVTPGALAALALLSGHTRSLAHEELIERCAKLVRSLHGMGARIPARTANNGELRAESIHEAVQMFVEADMLEVHIPGEHGDARTRGRERVGPGALYRVPERKRLQLDTSKNHIIHFLVERGLVALSVLHAPGPPADLDTVRSRVQRLSKLFKHEFRFRADASFNQIFEATLATMIAAGELVQEGETLRPGRGRDGWTGQDWLQTYASALRNFLEGYRVAARALTLLLKGPMSHKDFVRRALVVGDRMFLAGDVEMRESVSKPLIQNALLVFREEGYLEQLEENKYALAASFDNPDTVGAIEGRLVGFCDFVTV
jgi:glycerol-3-phosphate O-acyltransferase